MRSGYVLNVYEYEPRFVVRVVWEDGSDPTPKPYVAKAEMDTLRVID
jgi:hypothetical protein